MPVSVIMPIYNTSEELFERALSSLLVQTKKTFLVYVIDDGSDDSRNYREIIQAFKEKLNIFYFKMDKNYGPGVARNKGIEICHPGTDYILFLDADDILQPRAIEYLYSEAKVNDADIIVSKIIRQGKHRTNDGFIAPDKSATWLHGKIYKKSFLDQNEIRFLDKFMYNEDVYFNVTALNLAKKILEIDEAFYIWCNNTESVTRIDQENFNIKHNIEYIEASWQALLKILDYDMNKDIGGILGNIYNAYQKENEKGKLFIDELITSSLLELDNILKEKITLSQAFINKVKIGDENGIYEESPKEWYYRIFTGVNSDIKGLQKIITRMEEINKLMEDLENNE